MFPFRNMCCCRLATCWSMQCLSSRATLPCGRAIQDKAAEIAVKSWHVRIYVVVVYFVWRDETRSPLLRMARRAKRNRHQPDVATP